MNSSTGASRRRGSSIVVVLTVAALFALGLAAAPPDAGAQTPVTFTILHTNDFHGNLELSGSNPGAARVAQKIADVRAAVGAENALVLDAGDIMQGSLLSNLQQGEPAVSYYRAIGYDAATFGNHEFDWGQSVLGDRIAQAEAPAGGDEEPVQMVTANITKKNLDGSCTWEPFNDAVTPYEVFTVGTAPDEVRVGVIGVGSVETPYITIASATDGLCFRDPAESILHYYDALAAASDVQVVVSHNGLNDGGYGYGIPVYGDKTLAQKLNTAGKPVDLIVGGHSHTNMAAAEVVGATTVVQAYYAGRRVGRADLTYDPATKAVAVAWSPIVVGITDPEYPPVQALVQAYAGDPDYQALINQPVGYAQVDLGRNYNGDNLMGDFIDDAIYNQLNTDAEPANDADLVLNNAGGIRSDWCDKEDPDNPGTYIWSSNAADCAPSGTWTHDPMLLTYGLMFQILPFGNATAIGTMTGAQIYDLVNQGATLFKGAIQPSGIRYQFYRYGTDSQAYQWGAFDVEVLDRGTGLWEPLDYSRTYRVATNEFLAPAGQDGFIPFKYMKDISYWGDQLNLVNQWVSATYTAESPYRGPNGDGTLDGRITRNGNGDNTYDPGEVVPVTVLHHNDSHGRLTQSGTTPGYTNLATLIDQERQHNPERTLLVTAGDNIQGDSMAYYFKSAGLGYAADGTPLPPELQVNPIVKAFNAVGYDAWTLGNHEFNFGKDVFGTLGQFDGAILQANVTDDGSYGMDAVPVEPYTTVTVGPEAISVAILGIGNHRVPSYELPSNIPGLTFTDPIAAGNDDAPTLQADNDAVVALTHIGFTTDPRSVEVDNNVDTYFASQVGGVDAVIGGHSHTNPETAFGDYRFLPTFVAGPGNVPVLVTQAYRYNNYLGETVLGLLPDGEGGYETVARAGRYVKVSTTAHPEDPAVKALVQPYQDLINAYNATVIGQTTTPIDTQTAFTEETNGANLQADASVWKLETEGIDVDVHLSGAMTNRLIATGATPEAPYTLKVSDMFSAMPYENSLVVLEMNGPQLKAVLERAYRNYYFYKYVPGYGGYSYYTTCMLDTDAGNQIVYRDTYPATPDGDNVAALAIGGQAVDFTDASTYYRVSTVNYLAAGACNFSDAGTSLWPLDQIADDTQHYVRDAVIEYVQAQTAPISPAVEGRIAFPPLVADPDVSNEPSFEGHPVTASAAFTDPPADSSPYACTVDYGDGTGPLAGAVIDMACTGPAHTYSDAGTYTVTVAVTDTNGWTGVASTEHAVWSFSGFLPPLAGAQPISVKAGSTVPVKFSLGGYRGTAIFAPGYPQAGGSTITGKLRYDVRTGQYLFQWKTSRSLAGTSVPLTVTFVGGTAFEVQLTFRR